MRILAPLAVLVAAFAPPAQARPAVAGEFDYYVLALSWSPAWCSATGDARDDAQCDPGRGIGFVVHGLWPQYERGWPERCSTRERDPSRRESQAMADVMGSGGLAWYQWQKHGRCSGLSAGAYYRAIRDAADRIVIPDVLRDLPRDIAAPPSVIEDAFLEANPDLSRDGVTIACRDGAMTEVRLCLTRDLDLRACAPDAARDCPRPRVTIEAVR